MVDARVQARPVQQRAGATFGSSAFDVPALRYPFPSAPRRPDTEALAERTLAWTREFGLLAEEPGAAAKVRSYAMLAALTYPTATFDHLAIISDYNSWLFSSDDVCEDLSLEGASPGQLRAFLSQIYAVTGIPQSHRQRKRSEVDLFNEALRDIWARIERASAPEWRSRFIRHVTNYIDGCVWEAGNRNIEQIPSRAVYQCMRSYTSTMYEMWDLVELVGDYLLPDAVVEHPMVVELARTANMVVCLANDIFSLRKETSNQDIHNVVITLQQEEALTLKEAGMRAVELHDAQVLHYCALEKLLPSFGDQIDKHLARYCEGMRFWMRGNYDWSTLTPRYKAIRSS
jgi:hypothetical protein